MTENKNYKKTILISLLIAPLFTAGIVIGTFQDANAGSECGPDIAAPDQPNPSIDPLMVNGTLFPGDSLVVTKITNPDNKECFRFNGVSFPAQQDCVNTGFIDNIELTITDDDPPNVFSEEIAVNPDAIPGEYHCTLNWTFEYQEVDSGAGDLLFVVIPQEIWITVPQPPIETEKFYTDTNVNFKKGKLGDPLPFRDGTFVFGTEDSQVVKAVIDRNGKIKSYNPGQYIAVTKVTALEDLASVWIFEDDRDCTEETGISKMNPNEVPGGAYVALMCPDEKVEDLSGELAKSGNLFINNKTGIVEAHIEDVPEGCMLFLGVKYSPGLKGEIAQGVPLENRSCENWEDVEAVTLDGTTFTDSAHRVLEVTGFPELNNMGCGCVDGPQAIGCGESTCDEFESDCERICELAGGIGFFDCRPVDACFPF